jgi:predicted kinase
MGLTGAGKSTFISQVTQKSADIGHSLESCTFVHTDENLSLIVSRYD